MYHIFHKLRFHKTPNNFVCIFDTEINVSTNKTTMSFHVPNKTIAHFLVIAYPLFIENSTKKIQLHKIIYHRRRSDRREWLLRLVKLSLRHDQISPRTISNILLHPNLRVPSTFSTYEVFLTS